MLLSFFCSSCGCLWERVTVKTRFYRPKRLSILSSLTFSAVLNVPCSHSDQISTQFSTVYCYQIQLWQILASGTSGLQKQNIVVHLSGDGDLQSEILLQYKHQLNWKTFQFSHAGHVTQFPNFSCLSTRWRRSRSGGGAFGSKWLCPVAITGANILEVMYSE